MINHSRDLALRAVLAALLLTLSMAGGQAEEPPNPDAWPGKKSQWNGFDRYDFKAGDRPCYVVVPKKMAPGRPWVWRTTFPDFHPEVDKALLGKGFVIAHLVTSDWLGSPPSVQQGEKFYELLTTQHKLAPKVVLEGVSRGGLLAYNYAFKHPNQVACIYCDTPVLDFKSWPGGKGKGIGSPPDWAALPLLYNMPEERLTDYTGIPVMYAPVLAAFKIPIMHIVSEDDKVVPPAENTYLLKERLAQLGNKMEVISVPKGTKESNGHHFTHPDPKRVVEFIEKQAAK